MSFKTISYREVAIIYYNRIFEETLKILDKTRPTMSLTDKHELANVLIRKAVLILELKEIRKRRRAKTILSKISTTDSLKPKTKSTNKKKK